MFDCNFRGNIYIMKDNEILYEKVAGFADLANEVQNSLETKFASSSAGKVFVAVAILQLIEQGKLTTMAKLSIPNMYAKANLRRMDSKIQETIEICETHDPFGISASIRGLMSREDNVEFLKGSKTPILFVFGDSDSFMPVESAENILKLIPAAKGAFIPSTGHNSFLEEPSKVAQVLLDFLS